MLHPSETLAPVLHKMTPALATAITNQGSNLLELSQRKPTLVVFLRHSGCPFCLEAMQDIARQRRIIEQSGVAIVLVHMSPESEAQPLFEANNVGDLPRISDPEQLLYNSFGLKRATLLQLAGPKVWLRVAPAVMRGKRLGKAFGDAWQMPGVFLVHHGEVIAAYRHKSQADRPSYASLACSMPPANHPQPRNPPASS